MEEVYKFLKKCGTYFLATVEGSQPHVRPFGTIHQFEGKLFFLTGKNKAVSKQIAQNPKVELCAMNGEDWLRVQATAVEDDREEAKQSLLDEYPNVQKMYSATDDNTQVFFLKDVTATFISFTKELHTVKF